MPKGNLLTTLLIAVAIVLALALGFAFGQALYPPQAQLPEEFQALEDVWQHLQTYYVEKEALDPEALSQGAIEGLLEALDDPYTSYLDPETYELEWSAFEGSFEGVGAVVTIRDDELTVVSPIDGAPAEQQGVRAGDKLLEIDGEPTQGMTLNEAVLKIRGPEGTAVTLLILHEGATEAVEVTIVRQEIELDSVYLETLPDDIARVDITHFSERTHYELVEVLEEVVASDAEGIVLDLRDNPGGYLSVVVDVADEFLGEVVILYEQEADGTLKESMGTAGGLAEELPVVVLVNDWSASGSEVLAGALQDHGRADIVGTVTYGKGSVNLLLELDDGSALYVTTERWLTPDGHLIEGQGLTPDHEIELTEDDITNDRDPQLDFAIALLQAQP